MKSFIVFVILKIFFYYIKGVYFNISKSFGLGKVTKPTYKNETNVSPRPSKSDLPSGKPAPALSKEDRSKSNESVPLESMSPKHKIKVTLKLLKSGKTFFLYQNQKLISQWSEEIKINKENFHLYKQLPSLKSLKKNRFEPPMFGITTLGSSHGFDTHGSTSGFIIWINKKGIMVDPPPFSSTTLRIQGVPPMLIEKIIVTHCHADHDSGAFHKILESHPVEFLSTETIIESFLRKYSAIANIERGEMNRLIRFRTVYVGHPVSICGAKFYFSYSFHSIPALCFEVHFRDKKFFFSGDTFFDPEALKDIYENKKIFSKERYEQLAFRDFTKYDLILHEAGIAPIHTPYKNFLKLPAEARENLYLFHCTCDSIHDKSLKLVSPGLENTLVIIGEDEHQSNYALTRTPSLHRGTSKGQIENSVDPFRTNLELLASVDLVSWIPVKRMLDLLEVIDTVHYKKGQLIIEAGSVGTRFYFVKKGRLRIFLNTPGQNFDKIYHVGDYFGESAIFKDGFRLANVTAETDVTLLEIEKFDFLWVFSNHSLVPTNIAGSDGLAPEMQIIKNLADIRSARLAEFINENLFIRSLNESQKCKINMFIREKKTQPGEILWKKGAKCEFCFFVKDGKYQVSFNFKNIFILFY